MKLQRPAGVDNCQISISKSLHAQKLRVVSDRKGEKECVFYASTWKKAFMQTIIKNVLVIVARAAINWGAGLNLLQLIYFSIVKENWISSFEI